MIHYAQGNLLKAPAEALVNTVNEIGVMGKGIALMFRETFPETSRAYERAAKAGEIRVGRMFVTENRDLLWGPRWIIHFPTKKHWRHPSKLEWIREGLRDLVRVVNERQIGSVALPPLGCGSGGLDWELVRREIAAAAEEVPRVDFQVFGPTGDYQNVAKREGLEELTPARALIAELVRRYAVLGLDCTNLEIQKLAWFLDRSLRMLKLPDPLRLNFVANRYGPYAERLRHLLNGLDGSYLHCEKRLSDAGPSDLIWFEDSKREKVQAYLGASEAAQYLPALEKTATIIDGFESPLGLELLATIDWLASEGGAQPSVAGIREGLSKWPGGAAAGRRKKKLFDDRLVALALQRLGQVGLVSRQETPSIH
ncbi:MAG TPA: macro domain-containing protein [Vicinamibacterales bacterium]|nr:macro domain-containing protein [Vicinamibacterales bacterium]